MREELQALKEQALAELGAVTTPDELKDLRIKYLGKKGPMTEILRGMGALPAEERPKIGQIVNEVKSALETAINAKTEVLEAESLKARLANEKVDITLPGRTQNCGHLHPVTLTLREIKKIFMRMGFDVMEGPEIESDYYNFEALNLPQDHPARDMQDTFYITEKFLLRTQTSPVQARTMQACEPDTPIRMIAPGTVYRNDYDATHSPMFHQVEGLVLGENISLADLKGTLETFCKEMFGGSVEIRLRPSYFPFTEPSAEVDISCVICGGKGCPFCKGTGWVEILGCGMVDPNVLELNGIDSKIYSGYALGMGIERIANLKYRVNDLRLFSENDTRFLKEFEAAY